MSEDKITKLVESEMSAYFDGEYIDNGNVRARLVAFAKACSAIKDAEIADITQRKDKYFLEMCEVIEKNEKLLEEIAALELSVKELRELLCDSWEDSYNNGIELRKRVKEALAKIRTPRLPRTGEDAAGG